MSLPLLTMAAVAEAAPANPVSVHVWTFLFQVINVLVVLGGLYLLLFRPVGSLMKQREDYVEESLSHAAKSREEAEKLLSEYQEQMANVRQEAQGVLDKAARDAEEYQRRRQDEADAAYAKLLAEAKDEIQNTKEAALVSMREQMAEVAIMAASQVLGRALDGEQHRALIEDFIGRVTQLPQVVEELAGVHGEEHETLRVELITAVPLPDELCTSLNERLSEVAKREIYLVLSQDPNLVGGARMRVGGKFIDDSLSSRLRRLGDHLVDNSSST